MIAKAALGVESKAAERAFVEKKRAELVKRGVSPAKAERVAAQYLGGDLLPDVMLEFDDPKIGTVTVAAILEDPDRFIGETLPDPVEGRDYGYNCAIVMRDGDAIWSWAHGGNVIYHLKHDFNTIKAAIEGVEEKEATALLGELIVKAVLNDAEKDTLIKLAKERDKITLPAVRKAVKNAEEAKAREDSEKARAASKKPRIDILPGDLVSVVMKVDSVLAGANISIYRRDRDLVRPTELELPASDGRKTTVIGLKAFKAHDLCVAMAQTADFFKPDKTGDLVTADPPLSLAQKMLELVDKSHLLPIVGVISCPTLRPDGSVLSARGYDAATSMYHFVDGTVDLSSLRDEPTRDDALEAVILLEELLDEFPFVEDVDRTVAVSATVTAATRGMFTNVPVHAYTAPDAGTGKSFLSDITSLIISGKDCPVVAASAIEQEQEKGLAAALMSGCGLLSLDNLKEPLSGGVLCQAVTQPIIQIRPFRTEQRKSDDHQSFDDPSQRQRVSR